ncbi:ABC transporter substrate-binding protein [Echinicola marina]|uniref:ABC transporter substrate-binding protein n=1 Tax=Echinicola marina TaxID=2859768 RepID=UPI001CF6A0E2|nr:ABC transporter substrate-binding protein [Echinicola marina]UCS92360.1 ABC transporter substrate-binding protein [Echinicola marina]
MKKVGLLLPRSTYYASIGFDMHEGLKQGLLAQGDCDISVISENIGFGTDHQKCYEVVEKFLLTEEVDVVLAYISHRTAQLLRPLFKAANKILVVLDSGANLPQEWPSSTNTLYHSLHNSLGNWLAGEKASQVGLKKAASITGYYDGGYLHTHAGFVGYTHSGGNILFNHATGYKKEDFNLTALKEHLALSQSTDCFLSLFSGDYVQWYFQELNKHFNSDEYTVILPPFGLEESVLSETLFPNQKIMGVAAWSKNLGNKENSNFIDQMLQNGKIANLFSLLGYEAAFFVTVIIKLMAENHQNGKEACKSLMDMEFQTPRGKVVFHKATQTSIAPMYHAEVVPDEKRMSQVNVKEEIDLGQVFDTYDSMVSIPLNNATSGWINSYTCI